MDEQKQTPEQPASPLSPPEPAIPETPVATPATPPTTPAGFVAPPAPSPAAPTPAPADEHQPTSHNAAPSLIVLQWLTYAFWGWTILALSSMIVNVLSFYIGGNNGGRSFTPFGIAALLVLLPLSAVCDFFYSKHEPVKKTGASAIVMVIHAVLFALFAIGAFIGGVFTFVTMFTSETVGSSHTVALVSAFTIAALYGVVFLRTLNPPQFKKFTKFFTPFMVVLIGIVIILSIVGPVVHERSTRQDRLISDNIGSVATQINNEATSENGLPESLTSIDFERGAKEIVDKNLVTYKPNTQEPTTRTSTSTYSYSSSLHDNGKTYYYELCVTYIAESDGYGENSYYVNNNNDYQNYISSYSHPAGEVCYKVKTRY